MAKNKGETPQAEKTDYDALVAETFGSSAEGPNVSLTEELREEDPEGELEEDPEGELEEDPEGELEEDPEGELEEDPEGELEEDPEGELENLDDGTGQSEGSAVGGENGESDGTGGDLPEGEGADETLSDGLAALDMMVDMKLDAYVAPTDDFDPAIVGTEAEFIADAREAFGEDFDEDYAVKMGKASFKTAHRSATRRHAAGTADRLRARRDAATDSIKVQVARLGAQAPDELTRVEARMAAIYQAKVDRSGVDAANEIAIESYFRLAGGTLRAPTTKRTGKAGTATRRAKAQKQGAVRGQRNPDQIGRMRTGSKDKMTDEDHVAEIMDAQLKTRKRIDDFFFGD